MEAERPLLFLDLRRHSGHGQAVIRNPALSTLYTTLCTAFSNRDEGDERDRGNQCTSAPVHLCTNDPPALVALPLFLCESGDRR